MITVSDNDAASAVYRRVGGAGLYRVARAAHMTHFADVGNWADAHITAADQARLFLRIDRLAPRAPPRTTCAACSPRSSRRQRWGIAPVAAARDFHIMFKGGWRTNISHQVALLERDGTADRARRAHRAARATATAASPRPGVAERVLARRPRRS